jgi:hypothetical protein
MTSDMNAIESIKTAAIGNIGDELMFSFPEVLQVIKRCSNNEIAVLGVEVQKALWDRYQTQYFSTYELGISHSVTSKDEWTKYVCVNNALADQFVKQHPTGDDHFYVLTTSSWTEFIRLKEIKPAGGSE